MKPNYFIFILLLLLAKYNVDGQEIVTTSGDYFSNNVGSISQSIGEPVGETFHDNNRILTQGFQQSGIEITIVKEIKDPGIRVRVYPNPTKEFVNLSIAGTKKNELEIKLTDIQGKTLFAKKFTGSELSIPLKYLHSGTYLLIVNVSETESKVFKIIKQ